MIYFGLYDPRRFEKKPARVIDKRFTEEGYRRKQIHPGLCRIWTTGIGATRAFAEKPSRTGW